MVETENTRNQLAEELAQAQKRIAELEAGLPDRGKPTVDYDTLKTFFDSATDSFSIWDSKMNMVYLNDVTLHKYYPAGTKRSDVIGKHFTELIAGSVESGRYENYLNVLKTGKPFYLDLFTPHPKYGDMYLTIKVFKIENGLGIVTTDITERKLMEQELRSSQQRLSALIDNAPDVIFSYDVHGRFISGNRRASELLGYAKGEMIGKTFKESGIFTHESLEKGKNRLEKYKLGEKLEPTSYELIAKDGSHLFVEVRGAPVVSGDEIEIISIARDITERKKTEDALRQSEEKLRAIFESISDSITVIDVNGNITDLNDAAVRLFDCKSKEETFGMNGLTFIAEDDQPSVSSKFQEASTTKCVQYKFRRLDGSAFWGETSSDVLRDKSGVITGFIGIVRDISDRKKTEESLQRSEERYRHLAEDMPALICTFLPDSTLTYVNKAYCDYFQKSAEELLGSRFLELIPGDEERCKVLDHYASLTADNPVITYEHMVEAPDGAKHWQQWTDRALFNDRGELTGYQSLGFDITERQRMEETLRHNEEKFRVIFSCIADGISVIDLTTGKVIDTNEAALRMFNFDREDVIGMNAYELIAEKDRQRAMEDLVNTLQTGDSGLAEWCLLGKDGTEHDCEARASVIRDESWNPLFLVNVMRDITERKKMEEQLRQSEEKLRRIFESIGDAITILDMDGIIVDANETAVRMSGSNREEHIGRYGPELLAERDRARAVKDMAEAFNTSHQDIKEYTVLRKDGTEFPAETKSTVLYDAFGKPIGLINILRDITERKQIYAKLRESEEKLRRVFDSIEDGLSVTDLEGTVLDVNEKALQQSGYSRDEFIGKFGLELLAERDRSRAMQDMLDTFNKGSSGLKEYSALTKDGGEFPAETRANVLYDVSGKPVGLVSILRDITERKQMEEKLRQSEEKIRQIFNSVGIGISVTDMEGKVIEVNDFGLRLCGCGKDEIIGYNGIRFITERDRPRIIEEMIRAFEIGQSSIQEFTALNKGGTEYEVEAIATVFRDSSGMPNGLIISTTDISERKRIERELNDYKENLERMVEKRTSKLEETYEELRESEERLKISEEKLRTMFASMADGVVVTDLEGKVKDANTALLNMFGYNKEEVLGLNGFDFIAEEDRDLAMNDVPRLFSDGLVTGRSWTFKHRSERKFKAELSTALLKNANGNPTDILVVMRDITERKRMEEALRASEEKLRAIYDSIGDGITVTDLKGTIMDQNEAGLRLSGYSGKGDVVGRNGLLFIAETDRDRARNDMFNVLQKGIGITTEYKLVNKNGKEFDAEVSGAIITGGEGQPAAIVNVIRDITDRKHIEEALRESESKYRTLVEQSEQGICILQNGRVVFANNALAKINGSSLKEMYAMSPDELLLTVHPDDREAYVERVTRRLQGEKMMPRHEYRMIRKDGAKRQLETYAKRITYKGQPAIQSTIEDITERKKWEAQLNKSKEELRFYVSQITKAQEEERKRIARELHDDTIQELITLSRQLDDLIGKRISPAEDRRNSRKKIEQAQQKVAAILQSVRSFTRELRPSILDDLGLVPALEWLTSDMSNRFGIPVNISIIGKEQPASPDAALTMFRIAQESLRNAGQHSKASQIQLNLKFTSKTATLSVIDDGKGFTPSKQISSLTKLGKLGIAGMYERAQLIGATLSIKSKRKEGTTITLEVPLK